MRNVYVKFLSCFFVFICCISIKLVDADSIITVNQEFQDWDSLEYIDINRAFMLAITNNSKIKIASSKLKQAEYKILQYKSYYWPYIDLGGSLTSNSNLGKSYFNDDIYQLELKASWMFFNGFKTKYQNIIASYDKQIAHTFLDDTSRLLLVNVSRAFYKAQLALEKIRITTADEVFNKRLLSEAEIKYEAGITPLSDVLNFKIRLNNAEVVRNKEESDYKVAMNNLANLLGILDSGFASSVTLVSFPSVTDEELITPDLDSLIEVALGHDPKVKMKELLVKQSSADICINIADKYPKLSVHASVEAKRTGDMKFSDDDVSCTVCVKLSYNLFDGGLKTARIRELKERENELKHEVQRYLVSVKTEIKNAVLRINNAQSKVTCQYRNSKLMKQARDLVEKEYLANCNSLVRLNETQSNLIKAQSQLAIAVAELKQAWVELKLLTGKQNY